MASTPRYLIIQNGSTFHVTWQCHNQDWLLKEDWAKKYYYQLLFKYKNRYQIKIHSYSFMDNHPHLTGTLESMEKFSAFFRLVNSLFAKAVNRFYKRKGQVVMDRFKSPRIETDRHLLEVMIYVDLNPFRAKKVKHPKYYQYTSYGFYAYGKKDPLIDPPDIYLSLGNSAQMRQKAYREIVFAVMKKDRNRKRNFSKVYFIGNPEWVIQQKERLQQLNKNQKKKSRMPTAFNPS
ncbi:MAG: transposase [Deltaproteobacteria bacterium]|nr:transposase [Deltaproteobacteria bacterium]